MGPSTQAATPAQADRRWAIHDHDQPQPACAISTANHQSHDRLAAACTIGGPGIGRMMQEAGVSAGGRGWR
jgi:hypothetical protein